MAAIRGLSLPYGTKVRMTCDFCSFRKGDIITRTYGNCDIDDNSRFDSDNDYEYLPDSHWELIEETKEETHLAIKGLALPNGTKVRMTSDFCALREGDIVTRVWHITDSELGVRFDSDHDYHYLLDEYWELIEEPKEKLPTQGEYIQVRDESDKAWFDEQFVAFYEGRAITTPGGDEFVTWEEWRFPEEPEEVTLKNGKTYIVDFNDDNEMVLKLKN